jgi:hypothetical protein
VDRYLRPLFVATVFLTAYAAVWEAQNWIGVYWLDWWDPKFGSKQGNIAFGHEIMPLFLLAALVSWTIGTSIHWRWIRHARTADVALANAIAGIVSAAAPFWFSVALRNAPPNRMITTASLTLVLAGPAFFTASAIGLARRRARSGAFVRDDARFTTGS